MTQPGTERIAQEIWFTLADPAARLRLEQAAAALGYSAVPAVPTGRGVPPPACVGLVSDLHPPGPVLDWIEAVRAERGGIPVVLYLPVRTGVDAALSRAIALGVDTLIFQRGKADERDRLRAALEGALEQRVVAGLLDDLARAVPRSAIGFRLLKHYGIGLARSLDATDHIRTVADALGSSPRTLQRMLRADGWPGPKELLDWMLLFYVGLSGVMPEDRVLRRRIRRATQRLLGTRPDERPPAVEHVRAALIARLSEGS